MNFLWSVGTKIATGFCLALMVLIAIGAVAYHGTTVLITNSRSVTHTNTVMLHLEHLFSLLQDAETGQRGFVITGEPRYLAPYNDSLAHIQAEMNEIRGLIADEPDQQQRIGAMEPLVTAKLAELQQVIDLRAQKGFDAAAKEVLTDKGKKAMDDIRVLIGQMEGKETQLLERRRAESEASAENTGDTILLCTALAVILLGIVAVFITRNIVVPLRQVTSAANAIAAGDIALNLSPDSRRDEVGVVIRTFARMSQSLRELAEAAEKIAAGDLRLKVAPRSDKDVLGHAFLVMTDRLREMTRELKESVNVLATTATEILATATQLAAGATETATAVSETTTTLEEVKQTAQVSTQKAKHVSESAQKTVQTSQLGKKSAEETVDGMTRIREQMEAVAESIVRLSEQGQAIGEIIATVNDLADQSNLLAVNAAIEAAKAGEQGRGFAVVAQEVKSLAEQSKHATAQVRGILGDIQKATSAAVMATEQGHKAVNAGVKQSLQAGDSVRSLAESIAESAQAAVQIAVSAQQQLVGMDQVASAMESIKQASAQNAVSTRQAESSAQNLHALGKKLQTLVDQFQV